jgi:two-component system, NtrC family, nitrogen regulation response regulator GlnG
MEGRADAEEFDRLLSTVLPIVVRDSAAAESGRLYRSVMARVETPLLRHALELSAGNQLKAARLLGINRNTLRKRLRLLGLLPVARGNGSNGVKPA